MSINKPLPFNSKFQAGLINLLVTDMEFFRAVIEDLSEKHFDQGEAYIKLVRLIKRYWTKTQSALTLDIIKNYLVKLVSIDSISEPEHHGMLQILETGRLLAPSEYTYIKENVTDFLKKQTVALAFGDAINAYEKDDYDSMYDIMSKAYKKSFAIGENLGVKYGEESVADTYSVSPRQGVWSSGFNQLDDYLDGGFAKRECCTIISSTGRGKTSLMCNLAVSAIKQKKRTAFISLEMSAKQIMQRYDAIASGFSISEIGNTGEVQIDVDKFRRKYAEYKPIIKEFDRGSLSINGLKNYLDKLFTTEGQQDVVFVDWLACLKLTRSGEFRYDEVLAEAADALVNMSREYNVSMFTAMQAVRSASGVEDFNYSAVSASFASLFGQDIVLGLGSTDQAKLAGRRRLTILKSRVGLDSVYVQLMGNAEGESLNYRFKEIPKVEEEADLLTEVSTPTNKKKGNQDV